MPLAVTLCFDPVSSACVKGLWQALAEHDIDHDRHELGYTPHLTLGIYPDEDLAPHLARALEQVASEWSVLPVTVSAVGIFPGATSILWAAPVITPELLACQAALRSALPGVPVHPHYQSGVWMPHVTLSGPLQNPAPALAALLPLWHPFSGALTHLELIHFRPVERLKTCVLKGGGGL